MPAAPPAPVPDYLEQVYRWAYLRPLSIRLFDRPWVVNVILWGNNRRLQQALFCELQPGWRVLQMACVYGDLSARLARRLGPAGHLQVIDVAPIQVENCRKRLRRFPQASVSLADASAPGGGVYDAVVCFFLLHELPDPYKRAVVDAALNLIGPRGKAVFVDYHRPVRWHPLKWFTAAIFAWLEPFAKSLWHHRIADYATEVRRYHWRMQTCFGGLFQKTVATRLGRQTHRRRRPA